MQVETERLLVRRLEETDAEALFAVLSDPEVMRFVEPAFSLEQTRDFLRSVISREPPPVWAVVRKTDRRLIGHLIWHPWPDGSMELGWILRRDCWGLGYARELTAALLARTDRCVVIECSPEQHATQQIASSFGFVPVPSSDRTLLYRSRL